METETKNPPKTPPPYFAFKTLINTLDVMKEKGVPLRVDRSFLIAMSGAGQTQFIAGLKSLGLIDANGTAQPRLTELAQGGPKERRRVLAEILRERYPEAVELGTTNATTGQLVEVFKEYGVSGDTARKAIAFYLNASRYAGDIPLSPMFQTPKVSSAGGSTRRRRKTPQPAGETREANEAANYQAAPEAAFSQFHQTLAGVLGEFPAYPNAWTKARRDEVMKMFEMAVDFTIPVKSEQEIEEEEREAEEEADAEELEGGDE
jgi:hypothetical protein